MQLMKRFMILTVAIGVFLAAGCTGEEESSGEKKIEFPLKEEVTLTLLDAHDQCIEQDL